MLTLAEAKAFMGISDNTKDALITLYIDYVTSEIEAYLNNIIVEKTFTDIPIDTFHRDNLDAEREYVLKGFPVSNVVVKFDGTLLENEQDYQVSLNSGVIYFYKIPEASFSKYTVSYKAGYTVSNVPSDLKIVGLYAIKALFDANVASSTSGDNSQKVASKKIGDFQVTYSNEYAVDNDFKHVVQKVITDHANVLNRYKRFGI